MFFDQILLGKKDKKTDSIVEFDAANTETN